MNIQIIDNIIRSIAITGIWISLIILAYSPGLKILKYLKIKDLSRLDKSIYSVPLGFGLIASGIFLLGVAGIFKPWLMVVWIIILAVWSRDELIVGLKSIPSLIKAGISLWRGLRVLGKWLLIISGIILLMVYLQALTPPWDYDGLMYHLEGPRQFLKAGRILPLSFISQANGPMLVEMLFTLGIAFGIDQLSKLIHLTYGILLILATYSLGERYLGKNKGWMPAAMLIGTPMVVIIAGFVYIDLAWGLYTVLSIYAILKWREAEQRGYLILAGIFTGLMIGTKYFALGYAGIFLVLILWMDRKSEWRSIIRNMLIFGGVAFLIGMPWYLKNWILTGNPVYPLFLGGPYWPIDRVQISSFYPMSFGTGKGLLDYILLPINIFIHQERFSTFLGDLEDPNPWFLLILFFPLVKKKSPELVLLFAIVVFGFFYWAFGSQQIRFLLPLFTGLSILAAKTLDAITLRLPSKRLRRVITNAIVGAGLIYSLFVSINLFLLIQPLTTIVGQETREEFLTSLTFRMDSNYNSISYVQSNLTSEDRVLMPWEGKSYYCNDLCIPDTDNSFWTYLVLTSKNKLELSKRLQEIGATHLLINISNAESVMEYDRSGLHREAFIFLVEEFIPTCTKEIYQDSGTRVYELTCLASTRFNS